MNEQTRNIPVASSPWYYFALALGWSWFFWILIIVLRLSFESPLGLGLGLLGLLGPLVAGVTCTYLTHGRVGIVPLNVLFTWTFNNMRRSTLAIMLFHFTVKFFSELVALTPRAESYSILLWTLAAVIVSMVWGTKTFRVILGTRQHELLNSV